MSLDNFNQRDPFADIGEATDQTESYVHIRIQQRNGRKTLTTVQGIPQKFDPKVILKRLKKEFATNGSVATDDEYGEIIQFQGDQRNKIQDFIIDTLGVDKAKVKVHGF